ncbi:NapC/NirT family cytochrome c [Magnetospirillum sulfuroxidans]|uniref:NapC/NirT family cytochrome c n=1 Tax=Magnetospirillum sulfuroxidans TaxID=611300 RepID=UPI0031FEAD34
MRKWVLIGLAGIFAGIIGWGGFNTALEATNQMAFCISCHEMRDTVYGEYQQSSHFLNPSGIRATCADCHVPRDWSHKLIRKMQASGEVFHWAIGSIDSPEKFEAKRHTLAVREWDRMRAGDSQECRNCHSFEAMAFHKQSIKAARAMRDAAKDGKTCIDCHKAIAHKMPDVTAHHRRMFTALSAIAAKTLPAVGDVVTGVESRPLSPTPHAPSEGQLMAGHAVRVVDVAEGFVKIDIGGWRRDGTQSVLYARQGKRITLAILEEPALARLRPGREVEDADTGQTWTETHLQAWVPAGGFLRDPQPLWDYADRMAEDNCTLCHVRRPAAAYLANDWVGHMNSMKRLTPLSDAEAGLLLTDLQRQAKDGEK